MSRFLSSKYETLKPYTPGEQPKVVGRLIKLNTNENPYPPAPGVTDLLINPKETADLRLYPQPEAVALVEAIAEFNDIKPEQVMVGNGSDEILAFIFMAFQNAEAKILYPEISYSFYPVYCDIFKANGVAVPLQDFRVIPSDYFNAGGTIIITNPNAPTGIALTLDEIRSILDNNQDNLVVIDEAYVDFGADSAVSLLDEYDNLLVVQTFSKSRSLAGARVGFAMGAPDVIADLNKIKFSFNPYNLNRLSILAATEAMRDVDYLFETTNMIMDTREAFVKNMTALGFNVLPSKSNFVFVCSDKISGEEYFQELRKQNIIVRHFKDPKISNYVRITIGTMEDMMTLVEVTQDILASRAYK